MKNLNLLVICSLFLCLVLGILGCATPRPSTQSPQDLYKTLLSTSYASNELPSGLTFQRNSPVDLDATSKAFNAVGKVNTSYLDSNPNGTDGTISYIIFTKDSDAKGAFDTIKIAYSGVSTPSGFDYPVFFAQFGDFRTCWVQAQNVVVGTIGLPGNTSQESPAISIAKTALAHLKKVR